MIKIQGEVRLTMGLRELKKNKTRKMISDIATKLFIERGYDEVTTAEIAEKAEVSVPTLFKYFPNKEALVFDEDKERECHLVDMVTNRKKGTSILDSLLHGWLSRFGEIESGNKKYFKSFKKLIDSNPALLIYAKKMWTRHERSLADVIYKESNKKMEKIESEVVAHFILDAFWRALDTPNPKESAYLLFKILKNGWKE